MLLGLRLKDEISTPIEDDNCNVQFDGIFEIGETDGAYSFSWHDEGENPLTPDDIQTGINAVRDDGARAIFLSFPSNFTNIEAPLLESGFSSAGTLSDYYDDGVHERHYSLYR